MVRLFLILATLQGTSPQQRPITQRPSVTQGQESGSDSPLVSVHPLNAHNTAEETSQEDQRVAEATEISRRQLTANYILAGLAALAAGLSWWTFHQTRKITRQQLRAYVLVDSIVVDESKGVPDFPMPAAYLVIVKNFGQTPAHDFSVKYAYAIDVLKEEEAELRLIIPKLPTIGSLGLLGPGSSSSIHADYDEIPSVLKEAIKSGQRRVYVYGTLQYGDAFGHKHTTRFRFRREDHGHGMTGANNGNEAD